jgi:hypothetical protein
MRQHGKGRARCREELPRPGLREPPTPSPGISARPGEPPPPPIPHALKFFYTIKQIGQPQPVDLPINVHKLLTSVTATIRPISATLKLKSIPLLRTFRH